MMSATPAQRLHFGVNHRWNALCFSRSRITSLPVWQAAKHTRLGVAHLYSVKL